jgi:hypothetical protein
VGFCLGQIVLADPRVQPTTTGCCIILVFLQLEDALSVLSSEDQHFVRYALVYVAALWFEQGSMMIPHRTVKAKELLGLP